MTLIVFNPKAFLTLNFSGDKVSMGKNRRKNSR